MRSSGLRVGRLYALPTNPGPWYRFAVPARVMAHGPGGRVLVMLPDGIPSGPSREELPRSALVWVPADSLIASWEDWPAQAASTRADMTAVVASAVAALGGADAPTMEAPAARPHTRWWSRPVQELLRPPAVSRGQGLGS